MTLKNTSAFRPLRLIAFAAALLCTATYADEYSDVSQLVRTGKLADALVKADQYLAGKPRDPQMRFLKGVIQRDAGKSADAIATFTRLTEDYPELPEPYNNLAVLYAGQSQFDKARTALEMAIRTNPSYATAHENLGDVYAKLASQAYNKALQLDASNQAVAPKLALIRELFSAGPKTTRTNAVAAPVTTPSLPTPVAIPAPVATKPAPSLPGPVASKPAVAVVAAPVLPTPVPVTPPAPVAAVKPAPLAAVAPAPTPTPPAPVHASNTAAKEAEATVQAWAKAWAARDVKSYLANYGKEFDPPGAMKRSEWEEERRHRISSKSNISIKLENLTVTVDGNKAVAKFHQIYKASGLAVSSNKTLDLVKSGDRWHIVREVAGN